MRLRLWTFAPWLWLVAVLITISACAHFGSGPELEKPWFPHDKHAGAQKLRCTMCHGIGEGEAVPTGPTPELCMPCHEEMDQDKPPAERVAARFDASGRFERSKLVQLSEKIRFSHRAHLQSEKVDCETCHPNPDEARPSTVPLMSKRDCMGCHREHQATQECRVCHEEIGRDWIPPTHGDGWRRGEHGRVLRDGIGGKHSDVSMQRCDLCHDRKDSCQACHEVEAPRNHDNYFRIRGHGLLASLDRSRCMTCHRTDTCQQCHETTRPLSHRGGFGAPAHRHCTGCHFPLQDNSCFACHKSADAHSLATPMPSWHSSAMNCRGCHGAGQPLPHPDGGHSCTACHR